MTPMAEPARDEPSVEDSHSAPVWNEKGEFWQRVQVDLDYCCQDYRYFYSPLTLGGLALGLGIAAPLANTNLDQDIQDWYRRHHRNETNDALSEVVNYAGQLWIVLPVGFELAGLLGKGPADYQLDGCWFEWSNRCIRAMAVGAPPMLALYVLLGAERPAHEDSRWRPFEDVHGVSGHTFFAAMPLLTASKMTDRLWLKAPLWALSVVPAWSRIHDERHYFSQVFLGWWLAWLSVCSVDETQRGHKCWTIAPTWLADGPGMGVGLRY